MISLSVQPIFLFLPTVFIINLSLNLKIFLIDLFDVNSSIYCHLQPICIMLLTSFDDPINTLDLFIQQILESFFVHSSQIDLTQTENAQSYEVALTNICILAGNCAQTLIYFINCDCKDRLMALNKLKDKINQQNHPKKAKNNPNLSQSLLDSSSICESFEELPIMNDKTNEFLSYIADSELLESGTMLNRLLLFVQDVLAKSCMVLFVTFYQFF